MLALNAMLITVPTRRRLIEDIRLQGATRRMTVQILLFDAAVLGVLACVVGLALGELLSIIVFHSTPGYLSFAFPVGNERIVTWQSVAISICAGLAAAGVGVLWPFRQILRPSRRAEGSAHASRNWALARLAAGLAFLGLTTLVDLRLSAGRDPRQLRADRRACVPAAVPLRRARDRLRSLAASLQRCVADPRDHRAADSPDAGPLAGDRGHRRRGGIWHRRGSGHSGEPSARPGCLGAGHRLQRHGVGGSAR